MNEWITPVLGGLASVTVAVAGNWVAFRRYRKRAMAEVAEERKRAAAALAEESRQALITEEQLQASFRLEIREEMRRLRENDERRSIAYRKLEDENSDLRRKMAGLEIEVMQLRSLLDQHGVPHAVQHVTVPPALVAAPEQVTTRTESQGVSITTIGVDRGPR